MDETLEKAHLALTQGDRDEVLRLLKGQPNTTEVLWLRANAVVEDDERISLLKQVVEAQDVRFSHLAIETLTLQETYDAEKAEPPQYQFWKQKTREKRREAFKKFRAWYTGIVLFFLVAAGLVTYMVISAAQSQQAAVVTPDDPYAFIQLTQQAMDAQNGTQVVAEEVGITGTATQGITPIPTPTVTALPMSERYRVSYLAGDFSLVRIEYPTSRPVTFGISSGVAEPATGARFVAIEFEFICRLTICDNAPQASVALRLSDGSVVDYGGSSRPVLREFPASERVAKGQIAHGWLVFEVPDKTAPDAILLIYKADNDSDTQAVVYEIKWP